jgi:hypothetical protein
MAVGQTFLLWSFRIWTLILLQFYLWSDELSMFTSHDVMILMHCLPVLSEVGLMSYRQQRWAQAVYSAKRRGKNRAAVWVRSEDEVNASLSRIPATPAELLWRALMGLWDVASGLARALDFWGILDRPAGPLLQECAIWQLRAAPIRDGAWEDKLSYDGFLESRVFPERPGFEPRAYDALVLFGLVQQFDEAKNRFIAFVKAGGKKEKPVFKEAYGCLIHNREIFGQVSVQRIELVNQGRKFTIEKGRKHGTVFPWFTPCT